MAPRANVRLLTIRSANSCKQEGQPFRVPAPHPADGLASSITADTDRQRIGSSLRTAIELVAQSAGFNPAVDLPVPQFRATRQSGWVLYASWLRAFARTARSVRRGN